MYAALGNLRAPGLGPFRRKFIQVWMDTAALVVANVLERSVLIIDGLLTIVVLCLMDL
jgi:hypothetical protein